MYHQHANKHQVVHKAQISLNRSYGLIDAQFAWVLVILNSLYLLVTAFANAHCRSVFQYILNLRSIGSNKSLSTEVYYIPSIAVLHFMNDRSLFQQR